MIKAWWNAMCHYFDGQFEQLQVQSLRSHGRQPLLLHLLIPTYQDFLIEALPSIQPICNLHSMSNIVLSVQWMSEIQKAQSHRKYLYCFSFCEALVTHKPDSRSDRLLKRKNIHHWRHFFKIPFCHLFFCSFSRK